MQRSCCPKHAPGPASNAKRLFQNLDCATFFKALKVFPESFINRRLFLKNDTLKVLFFIKGLLGHTLLTSRRNGAFRYAGMVCPPCPFGFQLKPARFIGDFAVPAFLHRRAATLSTGPFTTWTMRPGLASSGVPAPFGSIIFIGQGVRRHTYPCSKQSGRAFNPLHPKEKSSHNQEGFFINNSRYLFSIGRSRNAYASFYSHYVTRIYRMS